MIIDENAFNQKIKIGETRETIEWDFKAIYNDKEPHKIAIDIAAFANRFGGSILFGIKEMEADCGRIASSILGIEKPEELHKAIESIKRRYLPMELDLRCHTININGKYIVSAAVYPMRSACYVKIDEKYQFPIRNDFGNQYLGYDEVVSMFDQSSRRVFLRFNSILNLEKEVSLSPMLCTADGRPCDGIKTRARVIPGDSEVFELIIQPNNLVRIPYSMVHDIWNSSNVGEKIEIRFKSRMIWYGGLNSADSRWVFE